MNLQRLLRDQVEVVAPDTMVVAEEFDSFEDSRRCIDLLALDRDANVGQVAGLRNTAVRGDFDDLAANAPGSSSNRSTYSFAGSTPSWIQAPRRRRPRKKRLL